MTAVAKKSRVNALERSYTGGQPETWRVVIEGVLHGSAATVKRKIFNSIEQHARALPGVQSLRVTARRPTIGRRAKGPGLPR